MLFKKLIRSKLKSYTIPCYCVSHKGNIREINEDFYLVKDDESKPIDRYGKTYILCDGMGGHKAGEVAAKMAAEEFIEYYYSPESKEKDIFERIYKSLLYANNKILDYTHQIPEHKGMGTTIVGLIIQGNKGYVFNIGDSKLFHISKGKINQLSEDHSLVNELKKYNILTEEQVRLSKHKNILTQSLGIETDVAPFIKEIKINKDDGFIICSDGLTNYIPEEEILYIYKENTLKDGVNKLLKMALDRGGSDNITAIAIKPLIRNAISRKTLFSTVLLLLSAVIVFSYKTYFSEFELSKYIISLFGIKEDTVIVQIINLDIAYEFFMDEKPLKLQSSLSLGEHEFIIKNREGLTKSLKFVLNKDTLNPFLIVVHNGEARVDCREIKIISDADVDIKVSTESENIFFLKASTNIYYLPSPASLSKDDMKNLKLVGETIIGGTEIKISQSIGKIFEFNFIFNKLAIEMDKNQSGERVVIKIKLLKGTKFEGEIWYEEEKYEDEIFLDNKYKEKEFNFSKENINLTIKGKDENDCEYILKWKKP